MNIRKANIEDIDNLLKIYIDGFRYHYNARPDIFSNKSDDELKEDLINTIKNDDNILILEDDYIKAMVKYQIKDKYLKVMWIDQLVVDSKERNKGYGKILINKIIEIAKKENCVRLELSCWSFNENAIGMYEHLGFKEQRKILEMKI